MHALLSNLLSKRNITKDDLSKEESQDFARWEGILSGGEVTLEKIQLFSQGQIGAIEANWKNLDNTVQKNERLIVMHSVYKAILGAMTSSEVERASLEKYLTNLINA